MDTKNIENYLINNENKQEEQIRIRSNKLQMDVTCKYILNLRLHLFFLSQGGKLDFELALVVWRRQIVNQSNNQQEFLPQFEYR